MPFCSCTTNTHTHLRSKNTNINRMRLPSSRMLYRIRINGRDSPSVEITRSKSPVKKNNISFPFISIQIKRCGLHINVHSSPRKERVPANVRSLRRSFEGKKKMLFSPRDLSKKCYCSSSALWIPFADRTIPPCTCICSLFTHFLFRQKNENV